MSNYGNYQSSPSESNWRKPLLVRTWVFIMLFLALGAVPFFVETWPGCLVSVVLFATAVSLMVFSYFIINFREEGNYKANVKHNLRNTLNVILACGAFSSTAITICWPTNCTWWIL